MADLPKDPMILLSVVNTKLRDFYADLDTLCQEMQIEKKELTEKLASIDYEYVLQKIISKRWKNYLITRSSLSLSAQSAKNI